MKDAVETAHQNILVLLDGRKARTGAGPGKHEPVTAACNGLRLRNPQRLRRLSPQAENHWNSATVAGLIRRRISVPTESTLPRWKCATGQWIRPPESVAVSLLVEAAVGRIRRISPPPEPPSASGSVEVNPLASLLSEVAHCASSGGAQLLGLSGPFASALTIEEPSLSISFDVTPSFSAVLPSLESRVPPSMPVQNHRPEPIGDPRRVVVLEFELQDRIVHRPVAGVRRGKKTQIRTGAPTDEPSRSFPTPALPVPRRASRPVLAMDHQAEVGFIHRQVSFRAR